MVNTEISFGTWVKRRRKALDMAQQDLARRVGCSNSAIFKIESDERRPSRTPGAQRSAQPHVHEIAQDDVRHGCGHTSATRMATVGVITNPASGKNRKHPRRLAELERAVGRHGLVRQTGSIDEIGAVIDEFIDAGCRYWVCDGGDGTLHWMLSVADARLRVYLYHIPQVSRVPISLALIERLLQRYPGTVAGIKDSSGDWSNTNAMLERFQPRGFDVFAGSEVFLLDTLRGGGKGCITATGNVNPGPIHEVYRNWRGPDADKLQAGITATDANV